MQRDRLLLLGLVLGTPGLEVGLESETPKLAPFFHSKLTLSWHQPLSPWGSTASPHKHPVQGSTEEVMGQLLGNVTFQYIFFKDIKSPFYKKTIRNQGWKPEPPLRKEVFAFIFKACFIFLKESLYF